MGGEIGDRHLAHRDPVAGDHWMPLVDRHRPQDTTGGAADDMPVVPADEALQPVDMEHLPAPAVDGDVGARLDDRPLARQIPLAGEALGGRHVGEAVGIVTERSRQVAIAPPDGAILAEVDPYLAGFRHAADQGRSPRFPAAGGSGRRPAGPGAEEKVGALRRDSSPALSRRLFPQRFTGTLSAGAATAPFFEGS